MTTGLLLVVACALALCGEPVNTNTRSVTAIQSSHAAATLPPAQRVPRPQSQAFDRQRAVLVLAIPQLGSISYRCRNTTQEVAATFSAAPLSATDQVSVSEGPRPIAHAIVQPFDPSVALPHTLTTPFGRYHSLNWLITQATEPHLIVARVRLDFVLSTARYQGARYPICEMSRWSANVNTRSNTPKASAALAG